MKHEKYVPGVNIPIISKNNLKLENPLVLVLAWNFFDEIKKIIKIWRKISLILNLWRKIIFDYNFSLGINTSPGDYSEEVIPDPIPNSEVKLFSADGTLS